MSARGFLDDFHNTVFKIKQILLSLRAPIPKEISGCAYDYIRSNYFCNCQTQRFMEDPDYTMTMLLASRILLNP